MNKLFTLLTTRRDRKQAREFLRHVVHLRRMREDVMPTDQTARCRAHERTLRLAMKRGHGHDTLAEARKGLFDYASTVFRDPPHAGLRENLEIIAVAVAVAMAARTYFIQPFKIPTGSMQPTLFGIVHRPVPESRIMDFYPLRPVNWLITGKWYSETKAVRSGAIRYQDIEIPIRIGANEILFSPAAVSRIPVQGQDLRSDGPISGVVSYPLGAQIAFSIAGQRYQIPAANFIQLPKDGELVEKGAVLWRGHRVAGDHVFVDKVRWNFQRPRRGQIMVFKTNGMQALEETLPRNKKGEAMSTHYIKRMVGLPGERLDIRTPNVEIDGKALTEPESIMRVARMDPPYEHGYENRGEFSRDVVLGKGEYFAMGDNTVNSRDSRYWGKVPQCNLVGPAFMVYWPFSKRWGPRD